MSAGSSQRVREVFLSGDFFTFTVVRHPLDRILSAYRERILNGCTAQSKYNVPALFVELKDDRGQCYKTFYGRNFLIIVMS
jgi:Sulfotransferase family